MTFDIQMIESVYAKREKAIADLRKAMNRPLTLGEKVLYTHMKAEDLGHLTDGSEYLNLYPDRVACQDATAQMVLLQFMLAKLKTTAVPTSIHCDHLAVAKEGVVKDRFSAMDENREVYDFLASASSAYDLSFWGLGAGIIHQVVLENYAFPGGMMIGTDSHTPNAGGLGMIAIGVGGADAVDVMAGMPLELKRPKLIGIKLTGKMSGWATPKDIILRVCRELTVKGGTNAIVEYFGEGTKSLSATGKATICNMGAEHGATTSIFPYDSEGAEYLRATQRNDLADLAERLTDTFKADPEVEADPEKYYDRIIEIDLNTLVPFVNGPFSPDAGYPINEMKDYIKKESFPSRVSAALIGSCTNSSYEDFSIAAAIARQALKDGLELKTQLIITPGSLTTRKTIERDGLLKPLEELGAVIMENACGPCIGMWSRDDTKKGEPNTIVNSFNRNFAKRNDGNPNTASFITSPALVMAFALSGDLGFNPIEEKIKNKAGKEIQLTPPVIAKALPDEYVKSLDFFVPAGEGKETEVKIKSSSKRLQFLQPFSAWNGEDYSNLQLLIRVKGKCTTDHISMAGPWLRFRGHLDNISDNMLMGALNSFNEKTDSILNVFTKKYDGVSATARDFKKRGVGSIVVAEENYGEGSSREHAAMEPRHLGVQAVITKSFARIHETNLKKQGVLATTFKNPADYDKIQEGDSIDIIGIKEIAPGSKLSALLHHKDGTEDKIELVHSYSENQINWFKLGSSLNVIATQRA